MLKSSSLLLASLFGASLGGTLFAPQKTAEQEVTMRFTYESETELDSMEMEAEGMGDMGGGMPSHEETRSSKRTLVVKDTYLAVDGGEATEFLRAFDESTWSSRFALDGMPGMEPLDEESDGEGRFVGKTVQFKKGDGEGEFKRRLYDPAKADGEWGDEDGDSEFGEALAGLRVHIDLGTLLSDKEVEAGDSWDIELEVYDQLKNPTGSKPVGQGFSGGIPGGEPERTGTFSVEFVEFKTVEDVRYADFALKLDLTETFDLSEQFAAMSAPEGAPEGAIVPEIESASRTVSTKGTGKARWNVEAGRWESLEWEAETDEEEEMVSIIDFGQGEKEMVHTTIRSGTESLQYAFSN